MITITKDTTDDQFHEFIKQAVDIREKGGQLLAGGMLTEVVSITYDNCRDLICAIALGERIVCSKHLYQKTDLQIYLSQMHSDALLGQRLNLGPEDRAVFYLRLADVYSLSNQHQLAEETYQIAHQMVRKGGGEEAEYLGHYADALVKNSEPGDSKPELAIDLIHKAFGLVHALSDEELEIKHRLIIESGLHGKLAKSAIKAKKRRMAFKSLLICHRMCKDLADKYSYPMRLEQFWLTLKGRNV